GWARLARSRIRRSTRATPVTPDGAGVDRDNRPVNFMSGMVTNTPNASGPPHRRGTMDYPGSAAPVHPPVGLRPTPEERRRRLSLEHPRPGLVSQRGLELLGRVQQLLRVGPA